MWSDSQMQYCEARSPRETAKLMTTVRKLAAALTAPASIYPKSAAREDPVGHTVVGRL
jgi:hypothetical protein